MEKSAHEHDCAFYMKVNNYKYGDEMRLFVIIAD
jgi:hypothetical protein